MPIFSWGRKWARKRRGKKKKKRGYIIQSSGFALTSTQGVTSLPHNRTKSCHPAIPITTTAFFTMLLNFPFGTSLCLSHPTGFYLKTYQSAAVSKAPACIPTTMTLPITYLPQNSLDSCSRAGWLPAGPKSATSTIKPWWHQVCCCTQQQIFLFQPKKASAAALEQFSFATYLSA